MNNHPKVNYTVSRWIAVLNIVSIVCIIGAFVYVIAIYSHLSEKIPIHFDMKGNPDNWGNKAVILFMPILGLLLFVPMYFLSKAPHVFNYPMKITEENAPRIYPVARLFMTIINLQVVLIFSYLAIEMADNQLGNWFTINVVVLPLVTVLLFLVILYKRK